VVLTSRQGSTLHGQRFPELEQRSTSVALARLKLQLLDQRRRQVKLKNKTKLGSQGGTNHCYDYITMAIRRWTKNLFIGIHMFAGAIPQIVAQAYDLNKNRFAQFTINKPEKQSAHCTGQ